MYAHQSQQMPALGKRFFYGIVIMYPTMAIPATTCHRAEDYLRVHAAEWRE
jgi:hypothetical protein